MNSFWNICCIEDTGSYWHRSKLIVQTHLIQERNLVIKTLMLKLLCQSLYYTVHSQTVTWNEYINVGSVAHASQKYIMKLYQMNTYRSAMFESIY